MRKAQGLPLNTIIIATIALVVLFVVILIFRGVAQKPGDLYSTCGQGIYAELTCVGSGADTHGSPLCVGALNCPDAIGDEDARCCPSAG